MIAAVVVTYRADPQMLERCLASVVDAGGVDLVVVVDTGGAATVPESPGMTLVRTANRGYGAAANHGARLAVERGASVVIVLNDDLVMRTGAAEALAEALHDDVGAAQPKLLIAGTSPPRINSLGVVIGADGAGTDIADGDLDVGTMAASELDLFTGGAVALSVEFLRDTGGFDERYFLYYEDVDLARRGAALGWRYRLVPAAVVVHERGASTGQLADQTRRLQERNRIWAAFRFADAATIARAVWLSVRRLRHPPHRAHALGLAGGLAGAPIRLWERIRHRDRRPASPRAATS